MKLSAIGLVLLLTLGLAPKAFAADDAPLVVLAPSASNPIDDRDLAIGKALLARDIRIAELEASIKSTPSPIVLVVIGLIVGGVAFAAGYGVARAATPAPIQ